jgi:hypothetical protein
MMEETQISNRYSQMMFCAEWCIKELGSNLEIFSKK